MKFNTEKKCPRCKYKWPIDFSFCPHCGTKYKNIKGKSIDYRRITIIDILKNAI